MRRLLKNSSALVRPPRASRASCLCSAALSPRPELNLRPGLIFAKRTKFPVSSSLRHRSGVGGSIHYRVTKSDVDTEHHTVSPLLRGTLSDGRYALDYSFVRWPKEGSSPQDLFVLIVVVVPFVMLIYFGLAVIICDNISLARGWSTALPLQIFSRAEGLAAAVTYIGLTAWLWLRWRKLRIRQRGIPR